MPASTMSENYKDHRIEATIVQSFFVHGEPVAQSIQSAGVSINGINLSLDRWSRANLPEDEYFAATQGDVTPEGLVTLAKKYLDTQSQKT